MVRIFLSRLEMALLIATTVPQFSVQLELRDDFPQSPFPFPLVLVVTCKLEYTIPCLSVNEPVEDWSTANLAIGEVDHLWGPDSAWAGRVTRARGGVAQC